MTRKGFTVWFTGLPSAGKTTLACLLQKKISEMEIPVEHLDGDEIRKHLTKDLGYSKEDRNENIRRITFVAKLLTRVGAAVITSTISPYRSLREHARSEIGNFVEVYVNCPLEVCIRRDVKGLYKKALRGEVTQFTGVSDPYEPPLHPEIVLATDQTTPEENMEFIISKLQDLGYISNSSLPECTVEH